MIKGVEFPVAARTRYVCILSILLLPLFFIHKNTHADWGDDYIQYIYQGHHLLNTDDYKTIVNAEEYGPVKRGVLFSALLSLNSKTDSITVYKTIISLTYYLSGLLIFLFLARHFTLLQSLLATLVTCYNYRNLWLKNEIVPEYLFMCFLYLAAFLLFCGKKYKPIIFSLMFACLLSVRTVGIIFYIAYLLHLFSENNKEIQLRERRSFLVRSIFWLLLFSFVLNWLLLALHKQYDLAFYKHAMFGNINPALIADNISFYIKNIGYFFEQEVPRVINILLVYPALLITMIGLIYRLVQRWTFCESGFVLYLIALLLWPYQGAAHRFLVPVLPLVLYFFLHGLNFLFQKITFSLRLKEAAVAAILIILLMSNAKTLILMKDHSQEIGPFSDILQQDFQYIREHTRPNDIVAFCKPYVINYKCDRNSFYLATSTKAQGLATANYFLVAKDPLLNEVYEQGLNMACPAKDTIELNHFRLYRLK